MREDWNTSLGKLLQILAQGLGYVGIHKFFSFLDVSGPGGQGTVAIDEPNRQTFTRRNRERPHFRSEWLVFFDGFGSLVKVRGGRVASTQISVKLCSKK